MKERNFALQDRCKRKNKGFAQSNIAALAVQLDVQDEPPQRQRGPKKQKGPKNMNAFRLPYRRYYTSDKTEVRVRGQIMAGYTNLNFSALTIFRNSLLGWEAGTRQRRVVNLAKTSRWIRLVDAVSSRKLFISIFDSNRRGFH